MRIAIIHLSDFHIKQRERFAQKKIDGITSALNVIGEVDDHLVVFSGDLSNSGNINEFKQSRFLFGSIINSIKQKNGNKFVNLFIVPGNHDLCLPSNARKREQIQNAYEKGTIEDLLQDEFGYLDNFYTHSNINGHVPFDKIVSRQFCTYGEYKIQFNLINTAPFSTLEPNDKELHYFPTEKMHLLKKANDANLCITVMHHSYEWFNWNYKSDLEKTIVDNSEILLYGHDHREHTTTLSIDNSLNTWVSAAGEMKFSDVDFNDSFNIIVIDTETNGFDGYTFYWDKKEKIYIHKVIAKNKSLQNHSLYQTPLPSFVNSLKEDAYNLSSDFTKYFVFPKLVSKDKNEYGKRDVIGNIDEFATFIKNKRKIIISGATNSGKTTLLKYVFCSFVGKKVPLFLSVDSKTKLNPETFIKHLFEEQYGEDVALYEKYQQLDNDEKIIILDGWDLLHSSRSRTSLMSKLEQNFGYIILSTSGQQPNVIESIKSELSESSSYCELHIKPFFTEKRNELVRNICVQKNAYNDDQINDVNRLIDSLVQNNSDLFSLNPAFIIRYTNYFMQDPYHDYTKGEAVFSKIFEHELTQSIISLAKRSSVDEIFTTFEEIAGSMYKNRKDVLPIEEIRSIIDEYNSTYGVRVNPKDVIDIGVKAKIFKQLDDLSIYFYNKNHLSYFIAKYLIRVAQNEPADLSGIEYALTNICFGINSDIILFISYLMNNTKMIMSIMTCAGELLTPWKTLSFEEKNIGILHTTEQQEVLPPTEKEKKEYENIRESSEEKHCSENVVEARGLFEYNDEDIDKYPYRLQRAIKYTEMICKALPAFNSRLKLDQKKELVESIYNYPRKIVYAMLRPLDMNFDNLCKELEKFIEENEIKKRNGSEYTKKDIVEIIQDSARATMLSTFDHFAEISTSPKSLDLLLEKETKNISESIEKLMIIESSNNVDMLLKEAESLLKEHKKTEYEIMIKLIVRKHLLTNKELSFSKKQQLVDKIFGKGARKNFLLN